MKIKYLYKLLVVAFVAIQLVACSNNDTEQKFDETPTGRINTQSEKLNELLLSSEYGWKAVYFTDNKQLGGYTHLFKFSPGGKVSMASDFDSDTKKYDSQYEIQLGSTVSVVFTTANRIHLLSDSNSFPNDDFEGQGYLGDFQFLFYGEDKGDIVFRTNRKFQELRFVKATAADWASLPLNIVMEKNVIGAITRPLFRLLETTDGTTVRQFDFNFDKATRFATADPISEGFSESYNFGVGYSPTGMIVSPAIVVKGQNLSEFVYDDATGSFTSKGTDGVSATIKYTAKPLVITEDYKIMLKKPQTGFAFILPNLATVQTNSPVFNTLINNINASLPSTQKVSRIDFTFNDANGDSYIAYRFTGGKALIYQNITVSEDAVNKTLKLVTSSWESNTGAIIPEPALLKNIGLELTNPIGLYVKKENFRIAGTSNSLYTFTSASGTGFRMTTFALQ